MRTERTFLFVLLVLFFAQQEALACETGLTHAEMAADRTRAVEFVGSAANSRFGRVVNAAGDANGDGFDDFVIAAPYESANAGAVYLVFGRSAAAWASAQFDFDSAASDASSWIRISGGEPGTYFGGMGIARGDFNGDGFSDLLVGHNKGCKAFVVFGHGGTWNSFSVSELESGAVPGFVVTCNEKGTATYTNVGNAGDMNGDGIEDLFVSAHYSSASSDVFVVFVYRATPAFNPFNASALDGSNGFSLIDGTLTLGDNKAMGSAGDVDGDGLDDLAIGSYYTSSFEGQVYVLFARNVSLSGNQWPASFNLKDDLNGTNGFIVEGPGSNARIGSTVVGAGDLNGDGFADIFIGTEAASVVGGAWILFGHSAPWTPVLNVLQLIGANGFRLATNWTAFSGGRAGDVNGDGFDDFIIGQVDALDSTGNTTGAAAIIFGHTGSWPSEFTGKEIFSSTGFFVFGPSTGSSFGYSARGAGDVNGDGLADFVVGAPYHNLNLGYAALVFGVDDHCAVCSNFTDACLVCDDGFVLNGTVCEAEASVVVVIETSNGTVGEVAAEVAQLLGVDVGQISVVEITPGTFEVTVINEEVAQQLVTLITQCIVQ